MDETNKNNNGSNILESSALNIDNPSYSKGKSFIDRASTINNRPTRMSTVYELKFDPKDSEEALNFIKTNKDSLGVHSISIVQENNVEEEDEKGNNINNKDEKKKNNIIIREEDKNLKILIETYGENAGEFEKKFNEGKQKNNLNNLDLKKVQELYGIDLDSNEKNTKALLTPEDEKLIERIHTKKLHLLRTLTRGQQCDFIDKLIMLADEKYKKQREALLERHSLPEYQYWLNLIFNSGYLTFDALVKLAGVVSKRQITDENFTSTYEILTSFWNNPFTDLADRDISGKRDRLRVMITPDYQAAAVACHIKLFYYLRNNRKGIEIEKVYQLAIQIAKDAYSKNNREFWSSFLLYVVGLSFLITLAGVFVTALLGLSGFAAFAPCAVLLVETLLRTGSKFHTDYKIWPWDWVYWWKDAKGKCLKVLQSDYMKDVLITGDTNQLNGEIRQSKNIQIEKNNINNGLDGQNAQLDKISLSKSNKKAMKSNIKLYGFLFWLSMIILAVSVMIAFYPSVMATAIPLVLSVFKLDVAFTIAPLVSGIFLWIAMAAMIAAIVFRIIGSNCHNKYQQLKFDTYQKYIEPDLNEEKNTNEYFMKLNGKHQFYTKEELKTHGIKVEEKDQKEINLNKDE